MLRGDALGTAYWYWFKASILFESHSYFEFGLEDNFIFKLAVEPFTFIPWKMIFILLPLFLVITWNIAKHHGWNPFKWLKLRYNVFICANFELIYWHCFNPGEILLLYYQLVIKFCYYSFNPSNDKDNYKIADIIINCWL